MTDLDVVVAGLLFEDLVFELATPPRPGAEVWADGYAEGPGGIANFAVALSRLGLRTGLAATVGDDDRGDRILAALTAEGVDLRLTRRVPGWPTPVTVAMSYDADRALVTRGTAPPLSADDLITSAPAAASIAWGDDPPDPPRFARAVAAHLGPWPNEWLAKARAGGCTVFADVGWDPTGGWDPAVLDQLEHCDVFTPNAGEAMRYTRTPSPARALDVLARLVPVAVVSLGADGALAVDGRTGERADVPGLAVPAVDPTGAGDVFAAGFIAGTLWDLPLRDRLAFANAVAALSVTRPGGAVAAPAWADLAAARNGVLAGPDHDFLDQLDPLTGR
jgi:sugar/nucleoside kinase (ribokinase family)